MKIMFQAVQAVTVELLGVLLVLWLLFGCASWGLRATVEERDTFSSSAGPILAAWNSQPTVTHQGVSTADRGHITYVAQRLDRYGHALTSALKNL